MSALNSIDWFVLAVLSAVGVVGLVAVGSPSRFVRIAASCSRWIDSEKVLRVFDKRIDVDQRVLPYSRVLGILVVLSVSLLAYFWMAS